MRRGLDPWTIAVTAMMVAVVATFTYVAKLPFTPTGGYVSLCDVGVFFAAVTFGPWIGLIAGGVGAGVADIISGFAQFAWLSFLAHGLEGLVAGYIAQRMGIRGRLAWLAFFGIVGVLAIAAGYIASRAEEYPSFVWPILAALVPLTLVAGYAARRSGMLLQGLAAAAGALPVILGYFAGEAYVMGVGVGPATLEVPANFIQVIVGAVVGLALVRAVRQAYPPVTQMGQPRVWKEM